MNIYCKHCNKEIKSKDELIVTTKFMSIVPYHKECYRNLTKRLRTTIIGKPINSSKGTKMAIMFPIIYILLAAIYGKNGPVFLWVGLILFIPMICRLYSYYKYEKNLNKSWRNS